MYVVYVYDTAGAEIITIAVELTSIISYIILIIVKPPVVKYIFVMIASAAGACVYPVIWPGKSTYPRKSKKEFRLI